MTNSDMLSLRKKVVVDYFNSRVDKTDSVQITEDNVYIVWFSKTLQNFKALVSTTVSDGMYYEITYNGDKNELYMDAYKKWENKKNRTIRRKHHERIKNGLVDKQIYQSSAGR